MESRMVNQMRDFWKYFALLLFGAALSLAGALIGKTAPGLVLYWLGLAGVAAGFIYLFVTKDYFKGGRLKPLLLGLVVSLLLCSALVLIVRDGGSKLTGSASLTSAVRSMTRSMTGSTGNYSGYTRSGNFGNYQGGSGTSGGFSGRSGTGSFGSTSFSSSGTGSSTRSTTSSVNYSQIMKRVVARLIGYLFLLVGGIMLIVIVISLLTKKLILKEQRWQTGLLGLLIGTIIALSSSLLLTGSASASFSGTAASGGWTGASQMARGGTVVPHAEATGPATVTATPLPTNTPVPTSTPRSTNTPTPQVLSSLVLCLDYNIQVGANIRSFPSDTAEAVGSIPAAGCFTIDGQDTAYPGWYRLEAGQNGIEGIVIRKNPDSANLWVNGKNFSITQDKLKLLPQVQPAAN